MRLRKLRPGPREGEGSRESCLLLGRGATSMDVCVPSRANLRRPAYAARPWVLPAVSCWEYTFAVFVWQ